MYKLAKLKAALDMSNVEFSDLVGGVPIHTLKDGYRRINTTLALMERVSEHLGFNILDTMALTKVDDESDVLPEILYKCGTDGPISMDDFIEFIGHNASVNIVHKINFLQTALYDYSAELSFGLHTMPWTTVVGIMDETWNRPVYLFVTNPADISDIISRHIKPKAGLNVCGIWYRSRTRNIEFEDYLQALVMYDTTMPELILKAVPLPLSMCHGIRDSMNYQQVIMRDISDDTLAKNIGITETDITPEPVMTFSEVVVRCILDRLTSRSLCIRRYQKLEQLRIVNPGTSKPLLTNVWSMKVSPTVLDILSGPAAVIALFCNVKDPTDQVINIFDSGHDFMQYKRYHSLGDYQCLVYWYRCGNSPIHNTLLDVEAHWYRIAEKRSNMTGLVYPPPTYDEMGFDNISPVLDVMFYIDWCIHNTGSTSLFEVVDEHGAPNSGISLQLRELKFTSELMRDNIRVIAQVTEPCEDGNFRVVAFIAARTPDDIVTGIKMLPCITHVDHDYATCGYWVIRQKYKNIQ